MVGEALKECLDGYHRIGGNRGDCSATLGLISQAIQEYTFLIPSEECEGSSLFPAKFTFQNGRLFVSTLADIRCEGKVFDILLWPERTS